MKNSILKRISNESAFSKIKFSDSHQIVKRKRMFDQPVLFEVQLTRDNYLTQTIIESNSLTTFLITLGGMYASLTLISSTIGSFFSVRFLQSKIASELYLTKKEKSEKDTHPNDKHDVVRNMF